MIHAHVLARLLILLLLTTLAQACGGNDDEAGAQELFERVQPVYATWNSPAPFGNLHPSNTLHLDEVRIFFNDVMEPLHQDEADCTNPGALLSATDGNGQPITVWPDGSIIVKEGHDGDGINQYAIMEKRNGEWFFGEYDGDGKVLFSGRPKICLNCHAGAMHDFTFSAHLAYVCGTVTF